MHQRSRTLGYLLAFFLGAFGAHLFYYKKYFRGLIYLIFCWTYIPIFLGWIDMLFIKKWHNQLSSSDYKKPKDEKIGSAKVSEQLKTPENKTKPRKSSAVFNKTFYNEEEIILPNYANLKTPASILKSVDNVLNPKSSRKDSGGVRIEYSYSHSHSNFLKNSHHYRNRTQGPTKEIPLQAYWTTFDHMDDKQLKWYFYWRGEALKGNYLEVDLSYIFVFVYELLNYSFNSKASFNVSMLVRLYENYVEMHPKLSNYLPRWIQDMLYELEEEELASEWKYRDYYLPPVYKLITEDHKPLNKISITYWKPYIRNYRETKFFMDNKNKIYKVFKEGLLLLEEHHNIKNKKIEEVWFTSKRVRNVANLFSGAVIGRHYEAIHVYKTEVQPTDIIYEEITALFRMSENVARTLMGEKREIKVDEEVLPEDFKNKLLDRYREGSNKTNERFKTVREKDAQAAGSVIPQKPVEEKSEVVAVVPSKPSIEFNDDNIKRLSQENEQLQEVFQVSDNEGEQIDFNETNVTTTEGAHKSDNNSDSAATVTTMVDSGLESFLDNNVGDEEGFISSLSKVEKEFLSLFNNGEYSKEEATSFAKKNGKMLGLFLSELNEKANEHLGDNIVESEGDNIILYDEYTDIAYVLKRGEMIEY